MPANEHASGAELQSGASGSRPSQPACGERRSMSPVPASPVVRIIAAYWPAQTSSFIRDSMLVVANDSCGAHVALRARAGSYASRSQRRRTDSALAQRDLARGAMPAALRARPVQPRCRAGCDRATRPSYDQPRGLAGTPPLCAPVVRLPESMGNLVGRKRWRAIESTFATVRLGQRVTKGPGSPAAGIAMAFKLIESARHRWRAVDSAPHLVVAGQSRREVRERRPRRTTR